MIDAQLIFDGTLNPTTGAAITVTRVSTNVIDLLAARDLGAGEILGLNVNVLQAFTGGTSLQIDFETCATVAGTYQPLIFSPIVPVAQLIIGCPMFRYGLPLNQVLNATAGILAPPGRFIRLNYTVVGVMATGSVFAFVAPLRDRFEYTNYPSNYTAYASPAEV